MSTPLSFHVLVLAFLALYTTEGVCGCSVTPSSAAVVAGDDLSLTCTTQSRSEYVDSWRLGSDAYSAKALYQALSLNPDGSVRVGRMVADGYLVNDTNLNIQVILTIVKASTDQANYYYCLCTGSTPSSSGGYVSVLASEPTFSNTTEIIDGESVIFTCSVLFNGSANTSLTIEDSSGNSLNAKNYDLTSKDLHSVSLNYGSTTNSTVFQEYFCNIRLSSYPTNTIIYSRKLNASVQWVSVRNVQITPINGTQCKYGVQCSINQKIHCTAEGNPKPGTFQWMTSVNGSGFTKTETFGDQFTFTNTGHYEVQCIAFNEITGTTYNDSSIFKTEVVMQQLNYPTPGQQNSDAKNSKTSLIVGLVVGLGGGLILIIVSVIVVFIFLKRKKRGTVCCNPDGNNQSVELNKTDTNSKTKDNGVKKNGHTTQAGVVNKGSDEVTVVENDLYSREQNAKKIDPSDGGYAAINEVMSHGR